MKLVDGNLSEEEQLALEELHQYLLLGDGCWALSDIFLIFVGRILNDQQVSTEARVHLLRALAFAALKDDIILLLHQDRRDHVIMNYLLDVEKIKPEEQQAITLFVSWFWFHSIAPHADNFDSPQGMQLVRKHKRIGMASLHQRMDIQRSANIEHSCDNKSRRPLASLFLSQTPRARRRSHLQLGHQRSKNSCKVSQPAFLSFSFRCLMHFVTSPNSLSRPAKFLFFSLENLTKNSALVSCQLSVRDSLPKARFCCSFRSSITLDRCVKCCPRDVSRRYLPKAQKHLL